MSVLHRYSAEFSQLPGWFSPQAAALADAFLSLQAARGGRGDLLEIGVYKGKSATLSTLHARPDEQCVFIDPQLDSDLRATIHRIKPSLTTFADMTSERVATSGLLNRAERTFRWIHIDGEPSSRAVANDLALADRLLGDDGLTVVNGFFDAAYPQVTWELFSVLQRHPWRFHLFIGGFKKAYLCRPATAASYLRFVRDRLYVDMRSRGHSQITIWKTGTGDDMNCFGIKERSGDFDYRGLDSSPTTIVI